LQEIYLSKTESCIPLEMVASMSNPQAAGATPRAGGAAAAVRGQPLRTDSPGERLAGPAALVCIGNITVDESVQPDGTRREALGGDAIFAVLAARAVGGDANWLAPIGKDLPPGLLDELRHAGLNPTELPRRDEPTIRNTVTYAADGSRIWDLRTGPAHFDRMSVYPVDVPAHYLQCAGILVLAMSVGAQVALVPWLRANTDATIYLDLEEDGIADHEAILLQAVASCDVFLPSEIEARLLSGTRDLESAARQFAELGPSCVVIKRAEHGCLVLADGHLTEVPTEPMTAVDPTGAGDAFCGAFAAAHLRRADAVAAARTATMAARLAIGGFGVEALLQADVR
jgi:sugar/nucleoside kinase (ribokinase family)